MSFRPILMAAVFAVLAIGVLGQEPLVKRTITKTDVLNFGAGGSVAIIGAPMGSVRVTGSSKNEIEIVAKIELQAPTDADLARLAEVTGFALEESTGRTGITSIGTHNKQSLKKSGKKLPKYLMDLPFRIDYEITVPQYCDLDINGGRGDLSITGVDGNLRVNFVESHAKFELVGGVTQVTIGDGSVDLAIGIKRWRGRSVDVALAKGEMSVRLPMTFSGDVDATILRTGKIENQIAELKPRVRKVDFTDKSVIAKLGVGGVPLKFSVGDGTLKLARL